ncbi:DNA topoisomerase IB [Agrilutibacter solisilvae]|uniref:DNA topoisomerase n=1 Tax=Agrilutibacter solisilvae TaxID=2763317 RepID=A0A974XZK7_9GAMM|nr:DNA topoisomerase IB [Lysobacter solisilvae]QSX77823.1 DNA topoisomerase IB [Lysobacter solisilvae]
MPARQSPPPPTAPDATAVASAREGGLVYVSDAEPGLRRLRSGRGFRYVDARGRAVRDAAVLARIRGLAIPPAYREVWICPRANGHLQATGRDARGRKQYRYHPRWREVRDTRKFDRITAFGAALPRLRRTMRTDLAREGLGRQKVLAMVVAVMADTLVRVGNDEYARGNKSYGLTTLRNRHIAFLRGGGARLSFRGKGGVTHEAVLDDRRLAKLVRRCQQLPGQHLFQYRDDDGALQPVDSDEVNTYLREATGEDFTAKDFRTWGATLEALKLLAAQPVPVRKDSSPDEREITRVRNEVIAQVARALSNTPAVCRKAYIDPAVFDAWLADELAAATRNARGARQWEQAALRILRRARRAEKAGARNTAGKPRAG